MGFLYPDRFKRGGVWLLRNDLQNTSRRRPSLVIPWKMTRENRWINRARGAVMAAFVVMPSTLTFPNSQETTLAAALRDGDAAFQAFDNEAARLCYQRAFAIDSTDCDVLWKLARSDIVRGMIASDDEKRDWFASSEGLARRCVALHPDSSEAHFFLAVAIGQMTKMVGGKRRIELSKDVRHEAEATLSLDPRHAGAMHVLGRWNYEVAGIGWFTKVAAQVVYGGAPPGASYEHAKKWFERAIALRPDIPLNHLWLGETLIKLDDCHGAREQLQMCLDSTMLWDDFHQGRGAQETARNRAELMAIAAAGTPLQA
jgi:tetratricopeptide (TPR) repeat protein